MRARHSNGSTWAVGGERQGAVGQGVGVRDEGSLEIEALDAAIGSRTKLVAVAHISNVLGTLATLREIVARAHAKGVPVLADELARGSEWEWGRLCCCG